MNRLTRLVVVAALLLGCVGCDQVTKGLAREHLGDAPTASFLHDTVRLTYAENPGAFLSLGASLPPLARAAIFQGGVGLVVLGLIGAALFRRGLSRPQVVALTLLGASGLGNLIDRVLHDGSVTDFLNIGIGQLRTGIFNVADIAGVLGVVVLLAFRGPAAPAGRQDQRSET
jgi:signal peptidase II